MKLINKDSFREQLPSPIIAGLKAVKRGISQVLAYPQILLLALQDGQRFARNYARSMTCGDQQQLIARIIFYTHSIEKGLSHVSFRAGFGKNAIERLIAVLEIYRNEGYSQKDAAFVSALSTLRCYEDRHRSLHVERDQTPLVDAPDWLAHAIAEASTTAGGTDTVRHTFGQPSKKRFFDVICGRRSVREFGQTPVDRSAVEQAIELATRTPSVCNRQGIRVRIVDDSRLVEDLQSTQGGLTGYPAPPEFLVVTADIRSFVEAKERNEAFVDGGLFSMSLLLALEALNLAACPLNAMFTSAQDRAIRKLLQIPDHEIVIMLIAVGSFPSTCEVPHSFRYSSSEITL
jgi:nitroreductase